MTPTRTGREERLAAAEVRYHLSHSPENCATCRKIETLAAPPAPSEQTRQRLVRMEFYAAAQWATALFEREPIFLRGFARTWAQLRALLETGHLIQFVQSAKGKSECTSILY
jgi:hypothetical protein